jgi:hypothetical protein
MRMWLVDPAILCRRHLLGEHVESHMFLGTLRLGKNIDGYIAKDLFQPRLLYPRHKALVEEMIKRGYNHNSPLTKKDAAVIHTLPKKYLNHKIDKYAAAIELVRRCPECRTRAETALLFIFKG